MFEFSFEAMGTSVEIRILNEVSLLLEEKIKSEVLDFTVWYDETFSRFKENSLVSIMSKQKGIYKVPTMLVEMLRQYEKLCKLTKGSMNPFIGNTISDLGYDAHYTLKKKETIRSTPAFHEAIRIIDADRIELLQEVLIDIGALGKGFWVDEVCKILDRNKLSHYIVNGSGDIYYKSNGTEPLTVALENPDANGENIGSVEIINEALCGSGINKRNWSITQEDNLHHVIDANTGKPTQGISAVWVKAKTTTLADGLATALFFVEPEILLQEFDFEYYIISSNKKVLSSRYFIVTELH